MNREMAEIIRNQKPLTLPPTATVQEACKQMHHRKVGAILVTNENGALLGIFTGRDAVRGTRSGQGSTDASAPAGDDQEARVPAAATHSHRCAAPDARWRVPTRAGGREPRRGGGRFARRFPGSRAGSAGPGNRDLGANALGVKTATTRGDMSEACRLAGAIVMPANPCPMESFRATGTWNIRKCIAGRTLRPPRRCGSPRHRHARGGLRAGGRSPDDGRHVQLLCLSLPERP